MSELEKDISEEYLEKLARGSAFLEQLADDNSPMTMLTFGTANQTDDSGSESSDFPKAA